MMMPVVVSAWAGIAVVGHGSDRLGDAEIHDEDALVAPLEHDVLGLDVAVHHPGVVCRGEAESCLAKNAAHLRRLHRAVAVEYGAQAFAGDHRHDDEGETFGLADVVHRDDVRIAQRGDRLRFATESLQQVGREAEIGSQHLDREIALEAQVARVEDLGKSARANPVPKFVPRAQRALQLADEVGRPDAGRDGRGDSFAGFAIQAGRRRRTADVAERRHPGEGRMAGWTGPGRLAHSPSCGRRILSIAPQTGESREIPA